MMDKRESENGQAIVFLVLGLVVFMGFVALAIDGGMAFADRRHSQNGADASSLAGGGEAALYLENHQVESTEWNCDSGLIAAARAVAVQAAIDRAGTNGFVIDGDSEDKNGVTTECGVANYGYLEAYLDVTVNISSTTETSFAQLLFPDDLVNQVEAVTRIRPRMPLGYGHAIIALNPSLCSGNKDGAVFGGSGETTINGGGVWSEGCLRGNGSEYQVIVSDGTVAYVGAEAGTMNFIPPEVQVPYSLPSDVYAPDLPDCNHPDAHQISSLNELPPPPDDNPDIPDDPHIKYFEPGLWCFSDGVHINASDDIWGEGVTIVIEQGDLVVNGHASVHLSAPLKEPDPAPAIGGLLFYVPYGDVTINGNSDQWYVGLIYAPGPDPYGDCQINGEGDVLNTFHTQVICWNVEVSGNALMDINYDPGLHPEISTTIELYR
jgi:hypothetical protein